MGLSEPFISESHIAIIRPPSSKHLMNACQKRGLPLATKDVADTKLSHPSGGHTPQDHPTRNKSLKKVMLESDKIRRKIKSDGWGECKQ